MDANGLIQQNVGDSVIDRETRDHYELLVGAIDNGTPQRIAGMYLNETDVR